jgi:L-fuconolactonase
VFDALVKPRHLAHLVRLVARHPEMKVVLDHGAKPEIVHGLDWPGLQNWRKNLRELARNPRVHCKLSGLVTEAAPQWSVPDIRPYFDDLTGAFGVRRLIWGSDWPVVELARGYGAWHAAAEELCRALRSDERAAVFGGNAETLYGLPGSHRA